MRHGNVNRKFGRVAKVRRALMRSLARALISEGRIRTTEAKAKELRPFVERLITRARAATSADRRILTGALGGSFGVKRLETIAGGFAGRAGGYTRIMKLPRRTSDGARMAVIEFVAAAPK